MEGVFALRGVLLPGPYVHVKDGRGFADFHRSLMNSGLSSRSGAEKVKEQERVESSILEASTTNLEVTFKVPVGAWEA